ncbi:MAG: NYN domain-containing protein [Acidimicrobiales bacterium]
MPADDHEPRIAVYLDYENLAIGARDNLGEPFDFANVADAIAERGRAIVRRAYADWSYFDSDRRMLTRHGVELIDIPQKMGGSRKNAADIKMAIDAIELALDRQYISTFVICTGDSDLSPLVQKLRELDRTVIGVGVKGSTSKLLPPACDEFLFYDNLVGATPTRSVAGTGDDDSDDAPITSGSSDTGIVLSTLAGLEGSSGSVRASTLKRAVLRKDPTFSEAELGYRGFGALLAALAEDGLVTLDGTGDPHVSISGASASDQAEALLVEVVTAAGEVPLTGLKTAMKKQDPDFSERNLGYRNFGSFVKNAEARNLIVVEGEDDDRVVKVAKPKRSRSRRR